MRQLRRFSYCRKWIRKSQQKCQSAGVINKGRRCFSFPGAFQGRSLRLGQTIRKMIVSIRHGFAGLGHAGDGRCVEMYNVEYMSKRAAAGC